MHTPNRNRVIDTFMQLASIRSPLLEVSGIMRFLFVLFRDEFGLIPVFDQAGSSMPGFESGNMFVNIPATPGLERLLCIGLEAHVDTVRVPAGQNVVPVVDGDIITSDSQTILGADDKAGLTVIIEALRMLRENRINHGPIQLLVTVGEEMSMYGVREMDYGLVKAQYILCVDGLEASTCWRSCAAKLKWKVRFIGKRGHGGFPEDTVNAILMAADAIDRARCRDLMGPGDLGNPGAYGVIRADWPEDQIWHNVSEFISDDDEDLPDKDQRKRVTEFPATNNVPGSVVVCGELRAFRPDLLESTFRQLMECFEEVAAEFKAADGSAQGQVKVVDIERPYPPFCLAPNDPLVLATLMAMKEAGVAEPKAEITPGATHANVFNQHGIPTMVIGAGCRNPHGLGEYVVIDEMVTAANVLTHFVAAG